MATEQTSAAFYNSLRLMAIDGSDRSRRCRQPGGGAPRWGSRPLTAATIWCSQDCR